MNYIVFDLEWNQGTLESTVDEIRFEIVEIGAIKLNERLEMIDTFSVLIKPQVYPEFNYQIHKVVPLNMKELEEKGVPFEEAVGSFFAWCGTRPFRFCTWGSMDLTELQKNLQYYQLTFPYETPVYYHDIQRCYGLQYKCGTIALETAVKELHIPEHEQFHRALEDAKYAAVIAAMLDRDIFDQYFSVDYYVTPKNRQEEIYVQYPTYQLYISREFATKEKLMGDKEICSTRCYLCKQNAKRKIRWFVSNHRIYYCQAYCKEHGYLIGKIRIRKTDRGFLAEKYLKLTDKKEAETIRVRRDELRERRREKKIVKREQQRENKIQDKRNTE